MTYHSDTAKGGRKPPSGQLVEFANLCNKVGPLERLARIHMEEEGWHASRWIIIPHPPTAVGLNGKGNLMWNRRKWWPALEAATRSQLIRHRIPLAPLPSEYHVLWYYKLGVEPDDDNIWGRLKHVRDTIAFHFGMDDRHLHTGKCRCYKNKQLAGYCAIIID